jgi:hypothetical protein
VIRSPLTGETVLVGGIVSHRCVLHPVVGGVIDRVSRRRGDLEVGEHHGKCGSGVRRASGRGLTGLAGGVDIDTVRAWTGRKRIVTRSRKWHRGLLMGVEPVRAISELAMSAVLAPLLAVQPRGDGHCVLVIPGWLASDLSTFPLRRYLSVLGYDVHGWGQGVNGGATTKNVAALQLRVAELARSSGSSVSVIGWSLGGHYAYQLARRNPAAVRQVITLGSPAALRWIGSKTGSRMADLIPSGRVPAPAIPRLWDVGGSLHVPVTSIYSRSDAVVAWRRCVVRPAPRRPNVQVPSSHFGLGYNPAVLHVIANRLAQRPAQWKPFRPSPLLSWLIPA